MDIILERKDFLEYILDCYNLTNCIIIRINSGSNRIYKCEKDNQVYYVRISARNFNYVSAEIEWINFLSDYVKVPVILKSSKNKTVDTYIEDGKTYVFCVFCELAGRFWNKNDPELWNETVFFNWGNTMGKMHSLSKKYHLSHRNLNRPLLEQNLVSMESCKIIPSVYNKMVLIQDEILKLPRDIDSYGFIHSDMHQQNILINPDHIAVLDFDDCQYGFYALDIGIALYHAIWWGLPEDENKKNEFALKIIKNFMAGYKCENHLNDFWLEKILLFMRYRQIDALSWHLSYFKPKNLDEVIYNDCFKIYYDFGKNIKFIEEGTFFDNCNITENDFNTGSLK